MRLAIPNLNLLLAWTWLLAGFVSGTLLGAGFHRQEWLGGYDSFKRRLYRLAHISFFGLGTVNLMFYLTLRSLPAAANLAAEASGWAFVVGALTMPLVCVLVAHSARRRPLFAIPVLSLIAGAVLLLWRLVVLSKNI